MGYKINVIKPHKNLDKSVYVGRNYEDYRIYNLANPNKNYLEMDCVQGLRHEKKAFLILLLTDESFLLTYVMEEQNTDNVFRIFNGLEKAIGLKTLKNTLQ